MASDWCFLQLLAHHPYMYTRYHFIFKKKEKKKRKIILNSNIRQKALQLKIQNDNYDSLLCMFEYKATAFIFAMHWGWNCFGSSEVSAQDGTVVLWKAHVCSLSSFHESELKTEILLVWLNCDCCHSYWNQLFAAFFLHSSSFEAIAW